MRSRSSASVKHGRRRRMHIVLRMRMLMLHHHSPCCVDCMGCVRSGGGGGGCCVECVDVSDGGRGGCGAAAGELREQSRGKAPRRMQKVALLVLQGRFVSGCVAVRCDGLGSDGMHMTDWPSARNIFAYACKCAWCHMPRAQETDASVTCMRIKTAGERCIRVHP